MLNLVSCLLHLVHTDTKIDFGGGFVDQVIVAVPTYATYTLS